MFQNMTYEKILDDMLNKVTSDVDKREGSIIYDALAPCAYYLAQTYFQLSNYVDLFFVDTTVGDFLDRKVADYGLKRKKATNAIRKIETNGFIDVGTRWALEDTTYIIMDSLSDNLYYAACEQTGVIGNQYSGILRNIDNVGDVTATLTDLLMAGSNEETDTVLRERAKQFLCKPSQDGNIYQYKQWASDYDGIGIAKVFPLWNGGNTVKIAITNRAFLPAEETLVKKFQNFIDPEASGKGNGVAPIGSKVTITGGTSRSINISGNVVLTEGYTEPEGAALAIINYLASITYKKDRVSLLRVGSILLDCPSISELTELKLNDINSDIALTGDEIPVLDILSLRW